MITKQPLLRDHDFRHYDNVKEVIIVLCSTCGITKVNRKTIVE